MEPDLIRQPIIEHRPPTGTKILMDLVIRADGALVLDGQDLFPEGEEAFGDSDYEYWTIVHPAHKDQLLIALLLEKYAGDMMATSKFRDWLTERNIPHEGGSF